MVAFTDSHWGIAINSPFRKVQEGFIRYPSKIRDTQELKRNANRRYNVRNMIKTWKSTSFATLAKSTLQLSPWTGWKYLRGGQMRMWVSTIKAVIGAYSAICHPTMMIIMDTDRLRFSSVFGVRNWHNNRISRYTDLEAGGNIWRTAVTDIKGASLFHRKS